VSLEAMLDGGATELVDEPCVVTLSTSQIVGRQPVAGPKPATFGRHDVVIARAETTTLGSIVAITTAGRALGASHPEMGEVTGRTRGTPAAEVFHHQRRVDPHAGRPSGAAADATYVLVTAAGIAKRITTAEILGTPAGRTVINLKPGDTLVAAFAVADGDDFVMVASNAQALAMRRRLHQRPGRGAGGVAGMKLSDGTVVIAAGNVGAPGSAADAIVLTHSDAGTAKVTDAAEVPTKGRAQLVSG
jgi:DNA gyrase subunit A